MKNLFIEHFQYHKEFGIEKFLQISIDQAKMLKNENWKTLSISRNKSEDFKKNKFSENDVQENFSSVCFSKSPEVREDYKTD